MKLTIDGMEVEVGQGTTVLEAARQVGIEIPTLCHLKGIHESASCRVCVVEVGPRLIASCTLQATDGMQVKTNTQKVRNARRTVIELLLSDHNKACLTCNRSGNCELQTLSTELNVRDLRYEGAHSKMGSIDGSSPSLVRDASKCILCGRCIGACNQQTVHAIYFANRGFNTKVATAYDRPIGETACVNCGQCVLACPVGALSEQDHTREVWRELADPDKVVIVQPAPAIRAALGEEFGLPMGTRVTGKMVTALKMLGFDKVFDTNFGADLTIMEESTELLARLQSGEQLPLMTSCCPGWVKFMEHNFPDLLDHLSTCKSPHEMEGAIIKSYYAQKQGIDPAKITVVSIMPCTAKKFEATREELSNRSLQDVDYVLTTRELARMIREAGIDFRNLPDSPFDSPIGEGTGAAAIFGTTGGVAEAALRTVFDLVAGRDLDKVDFKEVRGLDGVREAELELPNGRVIRTAVVHGLGEARKVMNRIQAGENHYDFIEVMACPGGCVNGGGQPIVNAKTRAAVDVRRERAKALYEEDRSLPIRKSHQNPYIQQLYEEFLGQPNSERAHELLHTHYVRRAKF